MNSKSTLNFLLMGGVFASLFIPLIISGGLLFPFITGKSFTFRILTELLIGLWGVGILFDARLRPKFSWLLVATSVFVLITIVADIFGANFYRSFWSNFERMDGLVSLLHLYAFFVVVASVLNTRARWQAFFNIAVVVSVIESIYAFIQLSGKIIIRQGGVRVDGTFGNATYLAIYMLFSFFITAILLFRLFNSETDKKNKTIPWYLVVWYSVAISCQLVVIYYAATRGVILGLFGGIGLSALIIAIWGKDRPGLRRVSIASIVAVLLIVGGFFAAKNTSFVQNSPTLSRFASISIQDLNSQGRRFVWPMAVSGFVERPILGWGQENFILVFNKYYDPRMYGQEPWFDRAHNIVLDLLVSSGALGLLAYLSMIAVFLILVRRSETLSLTDKALLTGLMAAYFFQNLFVFDNLMSSVYFVSILAFVHAEKVRFAPKVIGESALNNISNNKTLRNVVSPIVAVAIVVPLVYFLNIKPIQAGQNIIRGLRANFPVQAGQSLDNFEKALSYQTFANAEVADQLSGQIRKFSDSTIDQDTRAEFVKISSESLGVAIEKYPGEARYPFLLGSFLNRAGNLDEALKALEEAEMLSPNKQDTKIEIGLNYLRQNEFDMAFEKLKVAYELEPNYEEAKIMYIVSALYSKHDAIANKLVAELVEQGKVFDERLVSAYAETNHLAEAVKLVEKRVELQPNVSAHRLRLAAGYLKLGQRTKAIEVLRETAKIFPELQGQVDSLIKEIQAGRNPVS